MDINDLRDMLMARLPQMRVRTIEMNPARFYSLADLMNGREQEALEKTCPRCGGTGKNRGT